MTICRKEEHVFRIGVLALAVLGVALVLSLNAVADESNMSPRELELKKFDEAEKYFAQPGPGNTEWDNQYRSLLQTNENAVSKRYPSHADAVAQIRADAAKGPEQLKMHKHYVLFIVHASSKYRPQEATDWLRKLWGDLVALQFGEEPKPSQPVEKPKEEKLPFDGDPRLNIYRDVVYGKIDPKLQNLDAYIVKSDKPTPVLIEVHGGGWRRGEKNAFDSYGGLIEKVLDSGISVVSINYRLTPESQFPAQEEDMGRAVQFIRSKAKEWNIDPANRIASIGGSAGAHLSAWIGLRDDMANHESHDPVERLSTRLTCFVDRSGPMDLTRVKPTVLSKAEGRGEDFSNAFTQAFGATNESYENDPEIKKRVRDASPLFYVTPDDPPAFIMHLGPKEWQGKDHPPVPDMINDPHSYLHGVLLADAMEAAGIEIVRYIKPDIAQNREKGTEAILAFLKKHFKME
jgi:acetyl esterase/lipase